MAKKERRDNRKLQELMGEYGVKAGRGRGHGKSPAAAFYVEEGMFTGQFCMRGLLWLHEKRDVLWTLLDRCINRGFYANHS